MLVFKPLFTFLKVRCSSRKEALIALVTMGDMTQMEMILFSSLSKEAKVNRGGILALRYCQHFCQETLPIENKEAP
jgi:hypothetical protein